METATTNTPIATPIAPPITSDNLTATVEQLPVDAEQQPSTGLPGGNIWLLVIVGIWILVIFSGRKNKKKQQERDTELKNINKGDKVITIGRLHGVVTATTDTTFTIKPDPNKDYILTFDREALLRKEA